MDQPAFAQLALQPQAALEENAHAAFGKTLGQLDGRGFQQHLQCTLVVRQQGLQQVVHGEFGRWQNQRKGCALRKVHALQLGNRVLGRHDGTQRKAAHGALAQIVVALDRKAYAHVRIALNHGLCRLLGAAGAHMNLNRGVAPVHLREHGWHQVGVQAFHGGHADRAAAHATQQLQLGAEAVLVLQHRDHMARKNFAGGREPQARAQALEQRAADFVLELQQLAVDC